MTGKRFKLPSSSSMVAFECAARHLNFTRASEELNTSQSAVSRHISELETRIGVQLFHRSKRGLTLTENGKRLHEAISAGLNVISSEISSISEKSEPAVLTVTCTHEISHLYLMPRYAELQASIGEEVRLNILTQEYDLVRLLDSDLYDIALSYRKQDVQDAKSYTNIVLVEKVRPLCAPAILEEFKSKFAEGISAWPRLPLLEVNKPNEGWSQWSDWLAHFGSVDVNEFPFKYMTNYVYLLEAAAAGQGLVLGWEGLVERYIENGALVPIFEDPVVTENALCATLTKSGRTNEAALKCLEHLSG